LTFCASATNTSRPRSSNVSCTNRAPLIDSITAWHTPRPDAHGEMAQAVGVRRRGGLRDHLAGVVEQAHVQPTSTEIQSSVQHDGGPPRARPSMTR
jgi:hypothetical protein